MSWGSFYFGLLVGMPFWGALGALAIVLVASAKRADESIEPASTPHVEFDEEPTQPGGMAA